AQRDALRHRTFGRHGRYAGVKDTQLDSGHGPQTGQEPGTAELGDVLLGAAGACGFTLEGVDAAAAAARIGAPQAAKACVVLVDGLGWHNLMARADLAPFLSGAAPAQARSAFPSTTATNLAYLGTGERAGTTGMLGYTVRGPNGGLLNLDRKSTRLNSSHVSISYAVFCLN